MNYPVVYTKPFNQLLRALVQQGHKKQVQAVRAAISEAGMNGEILGLNRTKHGESRIPNVEKFDLSDGFRLVVQLVDGEKKQRAFLFVGSHDESDRWLDTHKNYRWVRSSNDGVLEFLQVTERKDETHIPADRVDLESPPDLLELPLLRMLTADEWSILSLPPLALDLAGKITGNDYEQDAEGLLERLAEVAGWEKACALLDLIHHSHAREWSEVHRRIDVLRGVAQIATDEEAAEAMTDDVNAESFITFDDDEELNSFIANRTLSDWMLFLHPEQKKVVTRDFNGAARLRGVSGSGKTSVLVHRARHLARKYKEPVLLVTLTESMKKLLDRLLTDLCGVERSLIQTMTMSGLAKQVLSVVSPASLRQHTLIDDDKQHRLFLEATSGVRTHADFARTPLHSFSSDELYNFVRDEVLYVRSRMLPEATQTYLDPKVFQRKGRKVALNELGRSVCLAGLRQYTERLSDNHWIDHEGVVAQALAAVMPTSHKFNAFRSVLADEVQDLSQLEIAMLANLLTPGGEKISSVENGFFLAGDGAQTIYRRGFTLKALGIDVGGRSYLLKKNYRNTYEILRAAFGLVEQFEYADVDEENIAKPSAPDFAKRHGSRPIIMRCVSSKQEAEAVASQIKTLLSMGHLPGQICIIGPSKRTRDEAREALARLGILSTDLRDDVDFESERIKISTIESAKGHEFGAVFIMGLTEGVLPRADVTEEEMAREVSRLYVAMTRARENLYLTYAESVGRPVSRFLLAIQDECDEAQYRNGEVRRLLPE